MPGQSDTNATTRILICESHIVLHKELAQTLTGLGYEIVGRVFTGEEAVQRADEAMPDLILMDLEVGGEVDGIEAAEQIRARLDISGDYSFGSP